MTLQLLFDGKILVRTSSGDHTDGSDYSQLPKYFGTLALVH